MNNHLVAQRFHDAANGAWPLDLQLDYVLTLRMRPQPVRLRLWRPPGWRCATCWCNAWVEAVTLPSGDQALAELLAFVNAAPVGLMQLSPDGRIELVNAMAARMLLPLSAGCHLDNLFELLAAVAPGLRRQVADAGPSKPKCLRMLVVVRSRCSRPHHVTTGTPMCSAASVVSPPL